MGGPVIGYMVNRRDSAKRSIEVSLETLEDGVKKARRALQNGEEVYVSFAQCLPTLIEAAAKYAVYLEAIRVAEKLSSEAK